MTPGAMMRRGVFLLIAVAVSLASCDSFADSITVVADPMENYGGWTLIGGSWGSDGQMGFNAIARDFLLGIELAKARDRWAPKGVLRPAGFPRTVYLDDQDDVSWEQLDLQRGPVSCFYRVRLDGYLTPGRNSAVPARHPSPAFVSWTTWTLQYTATAATLPISGTL